MFEHTSPQDIGMFGPICPEHIHLFGPKCSQNFRTVSLVRFQSTSN